MANLYTVAKRYGKNVIGRILEALARREFPVVPPADPAAYRASQAAAERERRAQLKAERQARELEEAQQREARRLARWREAMARRRARREGGGWYPGGGKTRG